MALSALTVTCLTVIDCCPAVEPIAQHRDTLRLIGHLR
jgi:hypothetical protein